MDSDKPSCEVEYCSSEDARNSLRMRIKWTDPPVRGSTTVAMMNPMNIKLRLECEKPIPLRNFSAYIWTHVYLEARMEDEVKTLFPGTTDSRIRLSAKRTIEVKNGEQFFKPLQENPEGIYREIKLDYVKDSRKWEDTGLTTYEFSKEVYPTSTGKFRLTYNVKYICPNNTKQMIWANECKDDCIVYVTGAQMGNEWTKQISYSKITQNMYLGNFLSILSAEDLDFDAVLNFDPDTEEQADIVLSPNITRAFQHMEKGPGAADILPADKIQDLVKWLWNVYPKYNKILIGDKDGISYAGSAITAYIFANNPNLTFEEAYRYVSSRRFIYCHKGLKEVLMESYPRD